ncbi:MAG: acyltransferase [Jatrophihabitans sp.]|nr:MAG: acyltransferase [Jatrophihabitans sp.]
MRAGTEPVQATRAVPRGRRPAAGTDRQDPPPRAGTGRADGRVSAPAAVAARPAAAAAGRAKRHVHEVDVVRVLTFAAVIAVHTISETSADSDVGANAAVMLLHFTREAFFCLTGFVLVHQYLDRPFALRRFWARRFLLVGTPYVVWSVAYTALGWWQGPRTGTLVDQVAQLGHNLLFGTAWYHMYFLLVSMQVYLLYPLLAELVRRTAGRHGLLLAAGLAAQLAMVAVLRYAPPRGGWLGEVVAHHDVLAVGYQLYVLVGALVAYHLDRCTRWLRAHRGRVCAAALLTAGAAEAWYLIAVRGGQRPSDAAAVWQPVVVPWSIAAVALLAAIGSVWAQRRRPGQWLDRFLLVGSDRSFGVYLVHPVVLWLVLWSADRWVPRHLHGAWLTLVAYALTVAGAVAATEVFRRSPISLALTGRPRARPAFVPAPEPSLTTEEISHAHEHAHPSRA